MRVGVARGATRKQAERKSSRRNAKQKERKKRKEYSKKKQEQEEVKNSKKPAIKLEKKLKYTIDCYLIIIKLTPQQNEKKY